MDRYITTSIIKQPNGKHRYASTIFTPLPVEPGDRIIRITSPERLDKLALDFYGNATWWPVIASANQVKKGTLVMPSGTSLRIPNEQSAQTFINNINGPR
jgi:hypothetical protein